MDKDERRKYMREWTRNRREEARIATLATQCVKHGQAIAMLCEDVSPNEVQSEITTYLLQHVKKWKD